MDSPTRPAVPAVAQRRRRQRQRQRWRHPLASSAQRQQCAIDITSQHTRARTHTCRDVVVDEFVFVVAAHVVRCGAMEADCGVAGDDAGAATARAPRAERHANGGYKEPTRVVNSWIVLLSYYNSMCRGSGACIQIELLSTLYLVVSCSFPFHTLCTRAIATDKDDVAAAGLVDANQPLRRCGDGVAAAARRQRRRHVCTLALDYLPAAQGMMIDDLNLKNNND